MHLSIAPEFLKDYPSIWAFLLPALVIYVGLAAAIFFLAPRIVVAITPSFRESDNTQIQWNDTVMFASGLAFLGWGLSRITDAVMYFLASIGDGRTPYDGPLGAVSGTITFLIVVVGFALITKFYRISDWMIKKRREREPLG